MSLLPTDTYVNSSRQLWASQGSGGGGGGNTLQSPASVTADVALGDSSLSLTAQGVGSSTLTLNSPVANSVVMTGGENAHIDLNGTTAAINFNSGVQQVSLIVQTDTSPNILQISNGSAAPVATFDVAFNTITLGNAALPAGATNTVVVNAPLTYSASAGAPKAGFPPVTLTTPSGTWGAGDNSIVTGGLAKGLYTIYGDSGGSTNQADLDARFSSTFQVNPAFVVSGGGGCADTGWNLSPNGTGGLTLNLTNAPTGIFSVKCFPLYLF